MAEHAFIIGYDGPALETREMAVRDLAPALLALGELFTNASVALYPNREPVSLSIRATADGSFLVQLVVLTKEAWDASIDIWGSKPAAALANLVAAVYTGKGVLALIKRLGGRSPSELKIEQPASGDVRIELPDGTRMEIPADVWLLYARPDIRRNAQAIVSPLKREGIDQLEFREQRYGPPVLAITAADVPAFDLAATDGDDVVNDSERTTLVEIVGLSYSPNAKWRLREGASSFAAAIQDQSFWERVHRREIKFAEGDMLRVRLRVVQTIDPKNGRLQATHFVLAVLDLVEPS